MFVVSAVLHSMVLVFGPLRGSGYVRFDWACGRGATVNWGRRANEWKSNPLGSEGQPVGDGGEGAAYGSGGSDTLARRETGSFGSFLSGFELVKWLAACVKKKVNVRKIEKMVS